MSDFEQVSSALCFGGTQLTLSHDSAVTGTKMRLSVFVPPAAKSGPVPVVYYLSGLTCTEENFTVKAGAQRIASELGLIVVAPDTSPRGADVPKIVDWYMEGKINIDDLITHTMPLEEINTAFDLMHEGKSIRSVVIY